MGDVHFLLRHALTGLVLILFVLIGWWIAGPDSMKSFIGTIAAGREPNTFEVASHITTLLVSAPLVGIAIQGVHILTLLLGSQLFTDPARAFAARLIRDEFDHRHQHHLDDPEVAEHRRILRAAPDDSLFVWLYHEHAPQHLIDWARRRRSYYYLGVNIALASVIGILTGLVIPTLIQLGPQWIGWFAAGATVIWVICAIWLAQKMKEDVDAMELTWVRAHIDPGLWTSLHPFKPLQPPLDADRPQAAVPAKTRGKSKAQGLL